MHQIISDEDELKKFYYRILPVLQNDEVYFLSLSARNKYLTKEEREELGLGRTEMFERRLIKKTSYGLLLRTIKKFETNEGSYRTKNEQEIPDKCIICYFNINPSSVLKAYIEFNKIFTEYLYEMTTTNDKENVLSRIKKMDNLMMNCIQKNRGTRHYIDIDMDIPKDRFDILKEFTDDLRSNNVTYFVIDTKGGYHVLLKKNTIRYNFTEIIRKLSTDNPNFEIMVNKNEMIPLPGTFQGGHSVTILEEHYGE